ncbi:MAG: hypothetical protein RLZZ618_3621 [Pseudomonadota bacterium]|jgi:hypothetical protein
MRHHHLIAVFSGLLFIASAHAQGTPDPKTPVPRKEVTQAIEARKFACVQQRQIQGWAKPRSQAFCACTNAEDAAVMRRIRTVGDMQRFTEADKVEAEKYKNHDPVVRAKFLGRFDRCLAQLPD